MAQITVEDLTLGYDGRAIVENLKFSVNAGDYLCIVGENGSGKTTLMKTLLRLRTPMGGKITMGDGVKENEIGYLPQQSEARRQAEMYKAYKIHVPMSCTPTLKLLWDENLW